jgi:hypothetical protein
LESKSSSVDISVSSLNTFTASNNITSLNQLTSSLATTGSNTFKGTTIISGSTYIQGDLVVFGSSSIQYISASSVSIGTNIVQLNTNQPAVRFAGISVQDSGSAQGVTGSIFWDGCCNRWIYSNPSGVGYSGGMLMSGPRNTGNIGDETGLTSGYVAVSMGGDHISSSAIYHTTSSTCFYGNTIVTSAGQTCGTMANFGCIGINTSTPSYTLDVQSPNGYAANFQQTTPSTYGAIRITGRDRGAELDFFSGSTMLGSIWADSSTCGNIHIGTGTAATERMFICGNNGYVGIGTSTPSAILHVSGTPGQNNPSIRLTDSAASGNGGNVYISADKQGVGYNNLTTIAFSHTFKGGASATDYLTINSAGAACFAGGVTVMGNLAATGIFSNGDNGNTAPNQFQVSGVTNTNKQLLIGYNTTGNGYGSIQSVFQGTAYTSLALNSLGGNVGIGTVSPNGTLEVYAATPTIISGASCSSLLHGIEFRQSNTVDAYIKQLPATGEFKFYVGRSSSWGGNMSFWTDTSQRLTLSPTGIASFACQVCVKSLVTTNGNISQLQNGLRSQTFFAYKFINENSTANFFRITTSGASSTHTQLVASNAGVGWYTSQIYNAANVGYWGGYVGSGTQVSRVGGEAGYISGIYSDNAGAQNYCVTVASNGTSTQSFVLAYITVVAADGYTVQFTQL